MNRWTSVRPVLSRLGLAILLTDVCIYVFGWTRVQALAANQAHLPEALALGARLFVLGAALALLAIPLVLFGRGWKRLPLVLACFAIGFMFVGFTLY